MSKGSKSLAGSKRKHALIDGVLSAAILLMLLFHFLVHMPYSSPVDCWWIYPRSQYWLVQ